MNKIERPRGGFNSKVRIARSKRPCKQGDPAPNIILIGGNDRPPQRVRWHEPGGDVVLEVNIGLGWLRQLAERLHARGPIELSDFLYDVLASDRLSVFLAHWDRRSKQRRSHRVGAPSRR
jgi:hypothetical protein